MSWLFFKDVIFSGLYVDLAYKRIIFYFLLGQDIVILLLIGILFIHILRWNRLRGK